MWYSVASHPFENERKKRLFSGSLEVRERGSGDDAGAFLAFELSPRPPYTKSPLLVLCLGIRNPTVFQLTLAPLILFSPRGINKFKVVLCDTSRGSSRETPIVPTLPLFFAAVAQWKGTPV